MYQLAIVIPYYKITFFRETLQSLADQTDQRFKVYIGNDSSPENPEGLLQEFEGKFKFVYKKFEENVGSISLTKQWERCIEMMEDEEWFMILGDDDYLSHNATEEFFKNQKTIEKNFITVIKLNSAIINAHGVLQSEKKPEPLLKSAIGHFFDKFVYEHRSSLSEHIFAKKNYEKFKFVDLPLAWHTDDLAILEFSEFKNILFLENAKCFVRVSSESISGKTSEFNNQKRNATKMFFDHICKNLNKFSKEEKRKLFDIIQWYEKDKNFKIYIPKKMYEYMRCYGLKKTLIILFW